MYFLYDWRRQFSNIQFLTKFEIKRWLSPFFYISIIKRKILFENALTMHRKWLLTKMSCRTFWSIVKLVPHQMTDISNNLWLKPQKSNSSKNLFTFSKKYKLDWDFWNDLAINKIYDIWESYKANNFNNLKCFDFESAVTRSEENVLAHLKRFLRNAPEETLALVLHFCTGSLTIENSEKIKIILVNQHSRNYYISAKSFFKILHSPKQIESFSRFKLLWEDTLRNPFNWVMED